MSFCFYSFMLGFRSSRLHVSYGRFFAFVFAVFILITTTVLMYATRGQLMRVRNGKGVFVAGFRKGHQPRRSLARSGILGWLDWIPTVACASCRASG